MVRFQIKNVGKTTALRVTHPGFIGITADPPGAANAKELSERAYATATARPVSEEGALFPSKNITVTAGGEPIYLPMIQEVQAQRMYLYVGDAIHRRDIFGNCHTSEYSMYYDPNGNSFVPLTMTPIESA